MFYKIHGVRLLIYKNDKLLILKRANSDKSDSNLWDIPGGKIENGENIFDAIKREVLEETGIELSSLDIKDLRGLILGDFDDIGKLTVAVFTCQTEVTEVQLNSEHSEYRWINPQELSSYDLGRVLKSLGSSL